MLELRFGGLDNERESTLLLWGQQSSDELAQALERLHLFTANYLGMPKIENFLVIFLRYRDGPLGNVSGFLGLPTIWLRVHDEMPATFVHELIHLLEPEQKDERSIEERAVVIAEAWLSYEVQGKRPVPWQAFRKVRSVYAPERKRRRRG